MGQAIPRQHPAVVLRPNYRKLRALLALTLVVLRRPERRARARR